MHLATKSVSVFPKKDTKIALPGSIAVFGLKIDAHFLG